MKISKNYQLGKNKFFNIMKERKDNKFFFLLPSIVVSPKHHLSWDTMMFSVFFGWGSWFIQFNICEIVKDTNIEVFKETMTALNTSIKNIGLEINDGNATLLFLNKNPYITQIVKNANLNHPYVKAILNNNLQHQPFIKNTKVRL